MEEQFSVEQFFDLSNISFADIFDGCAFVWDALKKLDGYVKDQFDSGKTKANYKDKQYVFVGQGSTIHESVDIQGPTIIGKNCTISHAALLRGTCLLGDGVHVGHASEIKDSVLLNNAISAHLNYIGNSIIGNNVNIAGGAALANFRFDRKPVVVRSKDKKIDTGLEKFGAVVGDNSWVGVNAVLNPGTLLGKESIVYPLQVVKGSHPNNTIIR